MKLRTETGTAPSWIEQSKIAEITALSGLTGAIDLAQGFSNEPPPPEILDFFRAACVDEQAHQYCEPRGAGVLRRNIAEKLEGFNGVLANPETEIVVTCGAAEGLQAAFRALFQPGDHILTFSPVYENYFHQANAAGLNIRAIRLSEPDFSFTPERLEAEHSPQLRAVLLCNPCNPTGKVWSEQELRTVTDFAARHDLVLISDETYERFIWNGTHRSIASLPEARDRSVSIFSMGKSYSVTGWRVGYLVAPEKLLKPIARVRELSTICAPHVCQLALARALNLPEAFYTAQRACFRERKNMLSRAVLQLGLKPWAPQGGYFLWCDFSSISTEDDFSFAKQLLHGARVAGVPGGVFFPPGTESAQRIRLTFSKSLKTIRQACNRLAKFQNDCQIPTKVSA